jgi:phage baseplate assembly protein W
MASQTLAPPLIGWPLLPVPDENGELRYRSLEESIRDHIRAVLLTRPGEQLMSPLFGAGLGEFLHHPNSLETRRAVRDRVMQSLQRWEQRVSVERVEVWEVPDRPTHLRVEIAYRIRRTGAAQQMGLVMELEG